MLCIVHVGVVISVQLEVKLYNTGGKGGGGLPCYTTAALHVP